MKVKVHWIIDGVAEIEADTPEDAEKIVENELNNLKNKNIYTLGEEKILKEL